MPNKQILKANNLNKNNKKSTMTSISYDKYFWILDYISKDGTQYSLNGEVLTASPEAIKAALEWMVIYDYKGQIIGKIDLSLIGTSTILVDKTNKNSTCNIFISGPIPSFYRSNSVAKKLSNSNIIKEEAKSKQITFLPKPSPVKKTKSLSLFDKKYFVPKVVRTTVISLTDGKLGE